MVFSKKWLQNQHKFLLNFLIPNIPYIHNTIPPVYNPIFILYASSMIHSLYCPRTVQLPLKERGAGLHCQPFSLNQPAN